MCCRGLDRHKCLSTPCSNAGGHPRSHQRQQQRQSLGTALLAHLLGICGLKSCDAQRFPSEPAVTSPDHLLLPWWPGMQLEPGKGEGKNFICQEPTGQVFVKNLYRDAARSKKIPVQQEHAHVWDWRGVLGAQLRMPSWNTDPSSSGQCHQTMESAAAWEKLSLTSQDQLPHQPLSCISEQQKPEGFPGYLPRSIFDSSAIPPSRRSSRVSNTSQHWLTKWVLRANIKIILFQKKPLLY